MKIQKVIKAKQVISEHIEEKITPKLGYKLLKLCKAIETEEEFFNKRMSKIVADYCKKNEDGTYVKNENGGIEIIEAEVENCNKAIDELYAVEVAMPDITFTIEELGELKLSVADLIYLEDFIKEG